MVDTVPQNIDGDLPPAATAVVEVGAPKGERDPLVTHAPRRSYNSSISWGETLRIGALLMAWYAFNVLYNYDNKEALRKLLCPVTISAVQLLIGWIFFCPLWISGYKKYPRFKSLEVFLRKIVPQGICHFVVHMFAVISLGLGAVSFTHIVKACEPVITSLLSAMFLNKIASVWTYMTLIPIIGGVGLASASELSFSWASFTCAMLSNVGSASRAIYAKTVMDTQHDAIGTSLDPLNLHAVLTIIATMPALAVAVVMEGPTFRQSWHEAVSVLERDLPETAQGHGGRIIMTLIAKSALWYYLYNVFAFYALEKLDQVTHAVANTVKRVVVIVSSVVLFGTPISLLGAVGSGIAIAGTFLYSLSKPKEHPPKATHKLPL